ncbi:MAG TPA: NAD-dependent epimerase/dehydratase family protein [Vicinamibacterales bacterium]|nr:NAD-dependent epimerase/dehydratase family protein [Vicinamibacterales bacterium]
MKVLVLGGTRFIGRHLVEALSHAGHGVSVFARGQSPDELPGTVERLRGDRDEGASGLTALAGRSWDACVDVSGYTATQVRPSAEQLRNRVGWYVFVSTVSVYEDSQDMPVDETHPLVPEADERVTEITGETYGPLKVTCERIVRELYADRATIVRPQIVAGPHDPTGRHTYWVQRAMQGDEMLAPGDGRDHVQVVDARDVARFIVRTLENGTPGVFNMAGPRMTWSSFMEALGARHPVWVPADLIDAAGLTSVEMPLFRPTGSERAALMHVSHERARAAGLTITNASTTIADVQAWLRAHPVTPALSPERERELIAQARLRRS